MKISKVREHFPKSEQFDPLIKAAWFSLCVKIKCKTWIKTAKKSLTETLDFIFNMKYRISLIY